MKKLSLNEMEAVKGGIVIELLGIGGGEDDKVEREEVKDSILVDYWNWPDGWDD